MLGTNNVYAKRLWSHTLRYFGGKDKAIKNRIATVKTIEKITKSMKMISSIKVRVEQKNLENGKDFGMDSVENIFKSDLYMQRKMPSEPEKPTQLIVSFTSDKGLCGSVNTNVVRTVTAYIGNDKSRFKMFTIGDKGSVAYSRPFAAISKDAFVGLTTPVSFGVSMAIANRVILMSEGLDSIALFYNKFRNLVSYKTTRVELMSKARFFE